MANELDFIHRFLPAPEGSASHRTLLLLHGTGGNENDLIDLGRTIDPQAAILSPRGKVLERNAARFFRRLAEGVFDEEDVVKRAHELSAFIKAAAAEYAIDLSGLVAVGYSNGANIAAAMMLLGAADFTGAILFRAMLALHDKAQYKSHSGEVLISEGRMDPIARPDTAQDLTNALQAVGTQVDLIFQPAGHELTGADISVAQRWLHSREAI